MRRGLDRASLTRIGYGRANVRFVLIPFAWITAAAPAQATQQVHTFRPAAPRSIQRLRAGGVFNRYRSLCRRLGAYSSSSQLFSAQIIS